MILEGLLHQEKSPVQQAFFDAAGNIECHSQPAYDDLFFTEGIILMVDVDISKSILYIAMLLIQPLCIIK